MHAGKHLRNGAADWRRLPPRLTGLKHLAVDFKVFDPGKLVEPISPACEILVRSSGHRPIVRSSGHPIQDFCDIGLEAMTSLAG